MAKAPSGPSTVTPAPTKRISRETLEVLEAAPLGSRIFLIAYHRNGADIIPLQPERPLVLGRDPPSDVLIPDPSVSRTHARFSFVDGVVLVDDLQSTNGTFVGGRRVEHATIDPGGEIALGGVRVRVHAAAADSEGPGLDSHERFRTALEEEVRRARHFRRTFAVLMVRAGRPDLHVSQFSSRVRERLRDVDRIATYSGDAVEVLCPEIDAENALLLGQALADGSPAAPLLVGVAFFPATSTKAEELVEQSRAAAYRAERDRPVQQARAGAWAPEAPALSSSGESQPVVASAGMRTVLDTVTRFARATLPVLIHGETGTGKEVVAHAIHAASPRRHKRMIVVNCGAIPDQLVESTLFGHFRGAFTGAVQDQKGIFEAADGSTVFLDEIGELSLSAQAALLRVLDTSRITRVGSTRETEVDVRVVAATHRDLEAMCEKGTFRSDLYFRLGGLTLTVPPLRERRDDIPPLIHRFLHEANQATGADVRGLSPSALALLQGYSWPGNVRELRNAIHRAVAIAQGETLSDDDLPDRVCRSGHRAETSAPEKPSSAAVGRPALMPAGLKMTMKQTEIQLILGALEAASGNQTAAAKLLKIPIRTLAHKIKTLGIRRHGFGIT
ncbi:Response regulator of zinc sigma-54-dependent two-component system [Minicystis rosea]|nr:Response regulator of zinc sigma-54-dependent two-component system [Minicystis rosea]